ncbi:MAG: RloB domain-containing protein [Clostridium sp.]|nr:RloB domain-containing protein [Clostridium sp.]
MAKRKPTNKYYFSVEGETEQIGKQIKYKSGYSNFTFDLWIILHMANCNASFTHRKQYITPINKAFGEKFENMDEYKHEDNFKRCLSKMNLSNVIDAIERARKIMQKNNENGYRLLEYRGYKYYKENPSLSAWEE